MAATRTEVGEASILRPCLRRLLILALLLPLFARGTYGSSGFRFPAATREIAHRAVLRTVERAAAAAVVCLPRPSSAATADAALRTLPPCDDAVSLLRGPSGREVVLIGTAHISEQSAALVRETIRLLRPDVVMIELDPKRIGRVDSQQQLIDAGFLLPPGTALPETDSLLPQERSASLSPLAGMFDLFRRVRETAGGILVGKVLQSFYKSIENLGFEAGGEFKAAVEEGRAGGAKILLGDRDVDITLQRLALAFQATDPKALDRLAARVEETNRESMGAVDDSVFRDKEQLARYVERMKQRNVLSNILGAVREEAPAIYGALIGERDSFMAESVASAPAKVLVGVVGIAHVAGIERCLAERHQFRLLRNNCPASAKQ